MSATSLVKYYPIKESFKKIFSKPSLRLRPKPELKAPSLTKNPSLVGSAFDYLFRFLIKSINPHAEDGEWIAVNGLHILEEKAKENSVYIKDYKLGCLKLKKAQKNYKMFLKEGKITDGLLESTVWLAKLERFYRVRSKFDILINSFAEPVDQETLQDLKNLVEIVELDTFKSNGRVVLNPSWKQFSSALGGADGDLIIDDLLIEIKTLTRLNLEAKYFNQLMIYYLLSVAFRVYCQPEAPKITRLGIYFSRYAFLYIFNVKDVIIDFRLQRVIDWFLRSAQLITFGNVLFPFDPCPALE